MTGLHDPQREGPAPGEPFLTIALATTDGRIGAVDVDRLPADPRWRYLVLCQCPATARSRIDAWGVQASAKRPDVRLTTLSSHGVANSRNAAIQACTTEALLFTDDDVSLDPAGLCWIISTFAADRSLGLLAGQTVDDKRRPTKRYPRRPQALTLFNTAKIGTVELAVRPRPLRLLNIYFDTAFGAGARYPLGDEFIFVTDCLKAGLRGQYHPIPFATHGHESSGQSFAGTAEYRARVFERVFETRFVQIAKLAFLVRHCRRFHSVSSFWKFAREFLARHPD